MNVFTLKRTKQFVCVLFMGNFLFYLISYEVLHETSRIAVSCNEWAPRQNTVIYNVTLDFQNGYTSPEIKFLGLDDSSIDKIDDVNSAKPRSPPMKSILVTATSSSHITNTVNWLRSITKLDLGLPILVFDLGLTKGQRQQLCLQQYDIVIWMNTSVRLKDGSLQAALAVVDEHGLAVQYRFGNDGSLPLSYTTSELTFKSFGHEPCAFFGVSSYEATILFVRKTRHILEDVMRPWILCALNESCISGNRGIGAGLHCDDANGVGFCHRFDNSVLSIILHGLYTTREQMEKIDLTGKLDWVKCYNRPPIILIDEIIFLDFRGFNQTRCVSY